MQTQNKLLDDLARVASGAIGVAAGMLIAQGGVTHAHGPALEQVVVQVAQRTGHDHPEDEQLELAGRRCAPSEVDQQHHEQRGRQRGRLTAWAGGGRPTIHSEATCGGPPPLACTP